MGWFNNYISYLNKKRKRNELVKLITPTISEGGFGDGTSGTRSILLALNPLKEITMEKFHITPIEDVKRSLSFLRK